MGDLRPPRAAGDERITLLLLWQYHRDSMVRKLSGLSDEDGRRDLVPSGISLLWLVKHLTTAETLWVLRRFAALDVELADPTVRPDDRLSHAIDVYRSTWSVVAEVIASSSLDDLCQGLEAGDPPTNLRWVVTHLLEETARHAGHADILRELIDGQTGR